MKNTLFQNLLTVMFTAFVISALTVVVGKAQTGGISLEEYVSQGDKYFEDKNWGKAAKAYEQAVKLKTDDPELFCNLGSAYYNEKQYSKAIAAYQETLRLDSNFPDARQYLADAENAEKKKKEARSAMWSGLLNAAAQAAAETDNEQSGGNQTGGGNQDEQAPRLGKYQMLTYGASSYPIRLGYFELLSGGKYNFYDNGGNFVGGGSYSFDAASQTVEWTSGVFRDDGWGGAFTIEREGKTHKIRLKSNTIGTNSTDSN